MSSLSMGIFEQGVEKGEKIGIEKGEKIGVEKGEKIGVEKGKEENKRETVLNAYKKRLPIDLIAEITQLSEERVKQIIEENKDTEVKKMALF